MGARESARSTTPPRDTADTSDQSHPRDAQASEALPSVEGYEVLSRIHSGAQGVVYKAVQKSTSRTVAVKLLPHEHTATDRQKLRFEREVGLAASLRHPNIVTVYDSGLTSGRYFFAMEYIHGKSLDEYLRSANLPVAERLRLFATICSAVSYAHQKGVIHRDLKPGNILVDAAGEPHVVDFGLAKSAGVVAMHGDTPFTLTSQFMGTLAYASPEQTMGDPTLIDMRSDVYALGVIGFEMLTGTYPYPMNPDLVKMFQTICHTPPRAPSTLVRELDHDVDTIVLRALAKEPERRYQTVGDLQNDVQRWLAGEPISARRDSLLYLARIRGRMWTGRHPAVASMVIAVAAALIVFALGWPVYVLWSWPFNRYEHVLLSHFGPAGTGTPYERIRLISITDETVPLIEGMAAGEGLEGVVAKPAQWKTLRRLHGRLMEKLAEARPAAVVWDIAFPQPADAEAANAAAPFNRSFVDGVKKVKAIGTTPVIVVRNWESDGAPVTNLSPEIFNANVRRAGDIYLFSEEAPWRVALVVKRGDGMRLPGLALMAMCEARHPDKDVVVDLHEFAELLDLRFYDRSQGARDAASYADLLEVPVASVAPFRPSSQDEEGVGLERGDVTAWMVVRLPNDEQIERISIPYHKAFTANAAELRQWFQGKLVVIGDARGEAVSPDWHRSPDGRKSSGLHAHVAAMDSLMRDAITMRFPNTPAYIAVLLAGALMGLAVLRLAPRSKWGRAMALILGAAGMLVISVAVYRQSGYLCNPMLPAAAMLLAFVAACLVSAGRGQLPSTSTPGGQPHESSKRQ